MTEGIELPPLTGGEQESIDAMRDQGLTDTEILTVVTIARLTGKRIGQAAMTYLVARDQVTPNWRDGATPIRG